MTDIFIAVGIAALGFSLPLIWWATWRKPVRWWKCSWCRAWFNEAGVIWLTRPFDAKDPVSHGMCADCAGGLRKKNRLTGEIKNGRNNVSA